MGHDNDVTTGFPAGRFSKTQSRPESSVVTRRGVPEGLDPSAMQVTRFEVPFTQLIDVRDATGALLVAEEVSAEVVVADGVVQCLADPLPVQAGATTE